MSHDDPARESWQSSVTEAKLPSIDELRAASSLFHKKVQRRNAIEYAASVVVVVAFSVYVFTLEHVLQRIGSAMVVAGTLFMAWQLHRRPPRRRLKRPARRRSTYSCANNLCASAMRWRGCSGGTCCPSFPACW